MSLIARVCMLVFVSVFSVCVCVCVRACVCVRVRASACVCGLVVSSKLPLPSHLAYSL